MENLKVWLSELYDPSADFYTRRRIHLELIGSRLQVVAEADGAVIGRPVGFHQPPLHIQNPYHGTRRESAGNTEVEFGCRGVGIDLDLSLIDGIHAPSGVGRPCGCERGRTGRQFHRYRSYTTAGAIVDCLGCYGS